MPDGWTTRISIIGWYGLDSTGDEAIIAQFIREMVTSPDIHLTIIAASRRRAYALYARGNVSVIEHRRCFGRGGWINLLGGKVYSQFKAVLHSDLIVVGGGSLLHDRGGLRNLVMTLDEIWLATLFGRRVALFAVGVGPLHRRISRWLVAKTVAHCDLIMVRDLGSKNLLTEIGVPEQRITVVPDPAFLMKPVPVASERAPWTKLGDGMRDKLVGVFLTDSLDVSPDDKRGLVRGLAAALDELHETLGLRFVFLPFVTQPYDDDRVMARDVVATMKYAAATQLVERGFESDEMFWIVSKFHLNITIRFHAMVFSLANTVPVIAIEYDPKVGNHMREFCLSRYLLSLDPRHIGDLVSTVRHAHDNRAEYVGQIMAELPRRIDTAGESFRLMRELISATRLGPIEAQND